MTDARREALTLSEGQFRTPPIFDYYDQISMDDFNARQAAEGSPLRACSHCGCVVSEIAAGWNDRGWLRGSGPGGHCGRCRGVSGD
ncbi:hypothetical protein ACG5V6_12465 [Streptomyces chitinivorans]|uniref:Uncharacterized protein n=1 Tax=Streptomyces chitinivorans TaxID=1257027 RepID=A0ABW7HUE9_9ACTN|nr:hypothetical protein [Streptomyces chitinivorans]MDH2409624.1 hypothetical protein [Streptomyces chitinivorans]